MKNELTNTEIAYFAGIVDGEGSISIHYSCSGYRLRLFVTSTNKEIMRWIVERFGGRVHACKQTEFDIQMKHRVKQNWYLDFDNAIEVIKVVYPYLIIKRKQAEIALRWPARYSRNTTLRRQLLEEIQTLNNFQNRFSESVQQERISVQGVPKKNVCTIPNCNDDKVAESAEMTLRLSKN